MDRPRAQLSVAGMLGLVASVALCIWLFRYGLLPGLLGLSVAKHVLIAQLCHVLGVGRRPSPGTASTS